MSSLCATAPVFFKLLQTQQLDPEPLCLHIGKMMAHKKGGQVASIILYGQGLGKTLLADFIQRVISVTYPNMQIYNVGSLSESVESNTQQIKNIVEHLYSTSTPCIIITHSTENIKKIKTDLPTCLLLHFQTLLPRQNQDAQMSDKLESELVPVQNYCALSYLRNLHS